MSQPSPSKSEYLTRRQIIDSNLRAAGWSVVPFKLDRPVSAYNNCAIEEFPTESGPADYALCAGGEILGVVEAKKLTLGPQEVLTQAERYSRGLTSNPFDFNGFHVPFLYSTNGEVIWHHDVRQPLNRSHQVAAFHTPEALREFAARDTEAATDALLARPNDHPRLRPYQREANAAIEQAIANRKRLKSCDLRNPHTLHKTASLCCQMGRIRRHRRRSLMEVPEKYGLNDCKNGRA
jgi:type I restriction enzyme R subunit